jgi:hypothetical protein
MTLRELFRRHINESRQRVHEAGVSDLLRALGRGEYESYADAMDDAVPLLPATDADVDASIARERREPVRIRVYVEAQGADWPAYVRERWLVYADALEFRFADPEAPAGPLPKHPTEWRTPDGASDLRDAVTPAGLLPGITARCAPHRPAAPEPP